MWAPMFLVGLVASAMRPYRRASVGEHMWNRLVDFVLISLFGAWAAGAMFASIPQLSGYDVPWSNRVNFVELVALVALVVRFLLENVARVVVSVRLARIENEELPEPGEFQRLMSKLVRTALFVFVASVFIEVNVWLLAGALMYLVPKVVEPYVEHFPNIPRLYRLLPRNLVRIVVMLFVMLWWGLLVSSQVRSNEVQWAFVLMSVPGLALGVADWFGREGEPWKSTSLSRILGVVTLIVGIAMVRGWIL